MYKFFLTAILVCSLIFSVSQVQAAETPQWIKNLPSAQNAEQILVVAATGKTTAWISMHERDSEGNLQQIMTTPGFIGKNGLGKTREGDSKTPVGIFKFNCAFGIAPDPNCAIPYTQVDNNIYWSGDANYKYNQLVDIRDYPNLNKSDSEHIIDYVAEYVYCLNISYNDLGTPGKGSAIFLHCFGTKKTWTGGCVAIPQDKMLTVMQTVRPDCVVVIDSLENLGDEI